MDEGLRALAEAQAGVLSRAQLLAAGVPRSRLGTTVRPREFLRVRHGAYVETAVHRSADQAQQVCLQVAAERLCTGVELVAIGRTAALAHALPVLGRPGRLQLAEMKTARPQHHGGSRAITPCDVVEVHGVAVSSLARTAVDVARTGHLGGVVTADAVLRRGIAREDLEQVLARSRRWPGCRTALEVVAFADLRAESALESVGRVRFHEHGLPAPELQVLLADADGPFARVDQCWPDRRTVAEADGALKYVDPAGLFQEKRREDRLREAGWEVVRYTWEEVLRQPEQVVQRVLRAFARAERRRAG